MPDTNKDRVKCPCCGEWSIPQEMQPSPSGSGVKVCGGCYDEIEADLAGFGEEDDGREPVRSCENCGCDIYEYDDDEFCDQCLWSISENNPGWLDQRYDVDD